MPRSHPIQATFAAGEWSERMQGRVDLQKYYSACSRLENFTILPQGGLTRRPGTRFIAECKYPDRPAVLIPFRYSTIQAYALEFGDQYIRFYADGGRIEIGGVPVEIVSPYAAADLAAIKWSQTADVLSLAHQAYPPHELLRFSHTSWVLQPIVFDVLPSREYGTRPNTTLTLSALTGAGVTATAGGAIFQPADVGRRIVALGAPGQAKITGYTSATAVTVQVESTFIALTATATGWKIDASPKTTLTPTAKEPVGGATTLNAGANAFNSTDIGKFIHILGGTVQLTSMPAANQAGGIIRGQLTDTTAAPAGAWTLEEAAWAPLNGYPRATGAFEDRRWWAGSTEQPQTPWGSKSGDFKSFAVGPLDDDAVINTINGSEVNAILWILDTDRLYLGTVNRVYSVTGGGTDNPLTPANVRVRSAIRRSSSALVPPIAVGDGSVFLQLSASGEKVWEIVYSFQVDKLVGPDLLKLAGHLTRGRPILRWAFHEEPDPTVWAVRRDGILLTCAYMREEDVVGWARQITQGAFESVAIIPDATNTQQVWTIVQRTINGATRRYVELFEPTGLNFATLQTDATRTDEDATPQATLTGLEHLEGMTVQCVGDGAVYPEQVVSAGTVPFDPPATKREAGLGYTSVVQTMRPEVPVGGSSQGVPKHWASVTVRLLDTLGLSLGTDTNAAQRIPFRQASLPLDQVVPPFSGDKAVSQSGWSRDGRITLTQDLPLPCTITMLTGVLDQGI